MISYELSTEQKIIQSSIAKFAQAELRPQSRRLDDASCVDAEILGQLWSTGIIQGLAAADSDERSAISSVIVLEELGSVDAALGMAVASTLGFVGAVRDLGSAQQRELLELFAGEEFLTAAVAVMEPTFGFDVSRLKTSATRDGDRFILRGKKTMVPLAGRCRHFLVMAASDGRTQLFIVPSDAPGVSIAESKQTLGLKALELAEVTFSDVVVPAAMRLGEGAAPDAQRVVDAARTALAALMTGLSRGVMEYVIPYVKERKVHGSVLAKKQTVAFTIADMHMDIEAMRWMTWKAAWTLDSRGSATQLAQLAHTYASQHTMTIADNGLQALGGHGFTKGHLMELWYRNARALSVMEGSAGV